MKTIKVSEATPLQLDWLVATIEFPKGGYCGEASHYSGNRNERWVRVPDKANRTYVLAKYSTNWSQGGPIIDREKISIECKHDGWWVASQQYNYSDDKECIQLSETPLIAAMRCYVASKLGNEVEIPEELV